MNTQAHLSSWWERHWKWVVPIGCFGLVVITAAGTIGISFFIFSFMRSSDVYKTALSRAQSNQELVSLIGEPITPRWYLLGNINISGPSGEVDIAIPISGPDGSCTVYAVAEKKAGRWDYEILEAECDGQSDRVSLLGLE